MKRITFACDLCKVESYIEQTHGVHFARRFHNGVGTEYIDIQNPHGCAIHLCLDCCQKLLVALPPLFSDAKPLRFQDFPDPDTTNEVQS